MARKTIKPKESVFDDVNALRGELRMTWDAYLEHSQRAMRRMFKESILEGSENSVESSMLMDKNTNKKRLSQRQSEVA